MLALLKFVPLVFSLINGKKTYITLGLGAATVIANHLGVPIPGVHLDDSNWLSDLFTLAAGATARHALAKI